MINWDDIDLRPEKEYQAAKTVTLEAKLDEKYFQEIFFQKVWPKLTGIENIPNINDVQGNPEKIAGRLWESLAPALDAYITKYNLPVTKDARQTDDEYFSALVAKMYQLNERVAGHGGWENVWPKTAIEIGATNCALGSQVLGRALQKAGYEVEFGMPGPESHAVALAKKSDGRKVYLDQANGVMVDIAGEQSVHGVKAYRIETDNKNIPFRLIPVCSLEKSTAATVWNLASLRKSAASPREGRFHTQALKLMDRFGLDWKISYGDWAKRTILPEWKGLLRRPEWKKEQEESSARIRATNPSI